MKKLFDYFQVFFPIVVIAAFISEIYFKWDDSRQVLFSIVGAIGWLSYLQLKHDKEH